MKKYIVVMLMVLVAIAAMSIAYADVTARATRTVYATIDPNVTLAPLATVEINAGTYQTGPITAQVGFRVDANKEQVCFFVEASALYKGADPTDATVLPIPLATGVIITPTDAGPFPGYTNAASFIGVGAPIDGFPTVKSETICFESSQAGHFSQNVNVTVGWNQNDPELPTGIYTGKVGLTALLLPENGPTGSI